MATVNQPLAEKYGKNYVVGKGELYLDAFLEGTMTSTGERYFGNSPELSNSTDTDTLDHYDADQGLNVKDESLTTQNDLSGSLTVDNISVENVAAWFGGDIERTAVVAATGVAESKVARRGRFIQLGTSDATPSGARHIKNVAVKIGSTAVTAPDNYEVDFELGRIFIEDDAPGIADLAVLSITYDVEASNRVIIVGKGKEVRGAVRFISKNPVGPKKDIFYPYVKLTSSGDFALKGDDWQSMTFDFEVLKKDAQTERVYIEQRSVAQSV